MRTMSTRKTPPTAVTVDQILDRCEQECLDELVPRTGSFKVAPLRYHVPPNRRP